MFGGKLTKFCKEVNEVVVAKGFWNGMREALVALGENPVVDEDIVKATKDAFIAQKIALIQSECGEALEAMRKDNYGLEEKDTFEDELADVFIRLADLCGELDIDIEKQIEWKLNLNKSRPALHGKKF